MEHDMVFVASAIATICGTAVAIIVAVGAYVKFLRERDADKKRASENLYFELKDTLVALDADSLDDWISVYVKENDGSTKKLYFLNKRLNHDFYDSLIFSGRINFLEPNLQQSIQNTFNDIKTHNEFVLRVNHLMEQYGDGTVSDNAYRYCEWLHENEPELEKSIMDMINQLKRHFKPRS